MAAAARPGLVTMGDDMDVIPERDMKVGEGAEPRGALWGARRCTA